MAVLLCISSSAQDPCVPGIIDALRERGVRPWVLDTDRFPLDARLTVDCDGTTLIGLDDGWIDPRELSAVWLTHTNIASALADDVDPAFHDAVALHSELALWDALRGLDAVFVDHVDALRSFPIGTSQLRLARAAGLTIPRTISSNDPARVRAFAAECGGSVVAKLYDSSAVRYRSADGRVRRYGPRVIGPTELADIDRVSACPQLFQELIPKHLELRVTVVGTQVFCAAVDSRDAEALDWGDDPKRIAAFAAHDLDEDIRKSILRLLDQLQLNFASIDLILTPEGRCVFLEVNPVSYFGFVERAAKLPISAALVELLAGEIPPRVRVRSSSAMVAP
jgi:glutathione synthase/RimK-type ligase-like ATP-grasp enzyme